MTGAVEEGSLEPRLNERHFSCAEIDATHDPTVADTLGKVIVESSWCLPSPQYMEGRTQQTGPGPDFWKKACRDLPVSQTCCPLRD